MTWNISNCIVSYIIFQYLVKYNKKLYSNKNLEVVIYKRNHITKDVNVVQHKSSLYIYMQMIFNCILGIRELII